MGSIWLGREAFKHISETAKGDVILCDSDQELILVHNELCRKGIDCDFVYDHEGQKVKGIEVIAWRL